MGLYENNIEFLKKKYSYINIEDDREPKEAFFVDNSVAGEKIFGFQRDEKVYYLNSRYEARVAASIWADQFDDVTYRTKFIILGIGNGMYLEALRERYPENMIIACELYQEVEQLALNEIDFSKVLAGNTVLVMGKERCRVYCDALRTMINYTDHNGIRLAVLPNYNKINKNELDAYIKIFYDYIESLVVIRNTLISDEEYRRGSVLRNMFYFPKQHTMEQLLKNVSQAEVKNRAAIIVASGPSLDKNIHQLKRAKGKAMLFAVDASAKAMMAAGVKPDVIVTIDPIKDESILKNDELLECPLVASVYSHYRIVRQHKGPIYFQTSEEGIPRRIYTKYKKAMMALDSGGSVANNAFSLAEQMGFQTIVLVGQDLAYPRGQIHASGAVYKTELGTNEIDASNKKK